MKSLILILLVITFKTIYIESKPKTIPELTLEEAELILGESCYLKESTQTSSNGIQKFKSTFLTNSSIGSSKVIALDYMFESYSDEIDAKKMFESFKLSNETFEGFELMTNLGDEAFFHTDKQNFNLVIARKKNKMMRIKINKITKKTSLAELKKISSEIVTRI